MHPIQEQEWEVLEVKQALSSLLASICPSQGDAELTPRANILDEDGQASPSVLMLPESPLGFLHLPPLPAQSSFELFSHMTAKPARLSPGLVRDQPCSNVLNLNHHEKKIIIKKTIL